MSEVVSLRLPKLERAGGILVFVCPCGAYGHAAVSRRAAARKGDKPAELLRGIAGNVAAETAARICRCDGEPEPPCDSWALTSTGGAFDFANPTADSIALGDIAHGLALECRFANQCREHYSVAQHSMLVASHAYKLGGAADGLDGLLHDGAEAYLGDWPRPLKRLLGAPLRMIERRIEGAIIEALDLEGVIFPGGGPAVKRLDVRALATERRDLMTGAGTHGERPWILTERVDPFPDPIVPLSAEAAEISWLRCFGVFIRELRP